jgi:hypothetical protein
VGFLLASAILFPAGPPVARADHFATAPADSLRRPMEADSGQVVRVLPQIEVIGSHDALGTPRSAASQGLVTPRQIALRPLLRSGDVLESIPGVLISQHSGEGKANQYYLRGFNLDHGTDFATTIAGIPVNMPTHAHGQGYTDLGFLIPELVSGVVYRKGTYSAEDGDFSSAGSAQITYRDTFGQPIVSVTAGDEGYRRVFAAVSPRAQAGHVLGALELLSDNGPWAHPDDFRKINGLVRYSHASRERDLSVTAMGYDGRWNSSDQVPERAVASGAVGRFGAIDPTDGGTSYRYSLSTEFQSGPQESRTSLSAYVLAYRLDLFSDFTYSLRDSVHGDQFEQADDRVVTGLRLSHTQGGQTIGLQVRHDNIAKIGLYDTEARRRLSVVREDRIQESSISPYAESEDRWTSHLKTVLGIRGDAYLFSVTSSYAPYSGSDFTLIASPKASIVLGPWQALTLYMDGGYGFHSDDARGARFTAATQSAGADPRVEEHFPVPGGPPIVRSPLLIRTKGAELGARLSGGPRWSASTALWGLDIASENVFVGDAGNTEPGRPSRRTGIELSGECSPATALHMDADVAYSRARFTDSNPAGDHVPGAVEGVVSAGIDYRRSTGWATVRVRYFGPRPLVEDNSVRSRASTVLNAQVGHRVRVGMAVELQVFNLLDSAVSDVDYYYVSRLKGEPADGVPDVHTHPQGPRSVRLRLSMGLPRD